MDNSSVISKPVEREPAESNRDITVRSDVPLFTLQNDSELPDLQSYVLSDLLKFHDRLFVLNAYAAIAKQRPSASELTNTLNDLRCGRRSKVEIIEGLVENYPNVRVDGLSARWLRNISRWPLIGYLLRVARAVSRLPVFLQHQQQFESYVSGQQQRMADYVNDILVANAGIEGELRIRHDELAETVSDAIKTLMMLSDSLLELQAQVAEGERQLQNLESQVGKADAELQAKLSTVAKQLSKSAQQLQKQLEQSEKQLHADLVTLTNQVSIQQQQVAEVRTEQQSAAAAQMEYLVEEQRVIVEAQRAAISDLQEQLTDLSRHYETKRAELAARLEETSAVIAKLRQPASNK